MPLSKSHQSLQRRTSTRSRSKLCRICHNLNPRGHPSSSYQSESKKEPTASLTLVLDALVLKKSTDCRFCRVLIQALDAFFDEWKGKRGRITVDVSEKRSIKVAIDEGAFRDELVEIYAGSTAQAPWPTLGTSHHIPINAGSNESFDFIRRCIQDCLTNDNHRRCHSNSSSTVPKRLVDVGRVMAPIKLIETRIQARPQELKYVALSHCWGTGSVLAATKENYYALARNIPFDKLPALFQDAIIITRQLGLRYIWIDSLCIIQDSVRDWQTESAKMHAIYENSYVTISTTTAGDSTTHCLVERRKPVKIPYSNTTGKEFTIRARKAIDHHPNVPEATPARPRGPLMTRAWALQEHVLSTRILHYTGSELLFECKTSYRCECQPARKTFPTTPALIPKALASSKPYAIWEAWQHIVNQYSKRGLTIAADKLPAISGIAGKIQEATKSEYIAGLWKENLASDLTWSVDSSVSQSYLLDSYRAPTFSWASIDAPVSYHEPDDEERVTYKSRISITSVDVRCSGLNPLGTVSHGSIAIRGPALQALLTSSFDDGKTSYTLLIKGTSAIKIMHDCALVEDEVTSTEGAMQRTIRRAASTEEPQVFQTSVLCLSVASYDLWISGIVLGLSSRIRGAYERLGTFVAGTEAFTKAEERDITLV